MNKRYFYVVLTYILVQLSGFIGAPLLLSIKPDLTNEEVFAIWTIISFSVGLITVLLLLKPDIKDRHRYSNRSSKLDALKWSFIGIFMALGAQYIAALIEMNLFGIEMGSENTEILVDVTKVIPLFIIVTSIIGPILEEIIFRKIIFGSLYNRFNFWIAAFISSLIFAAVHMDFEHLLIYSAMGFTFAFLYVKTKRIIVPIIAHISMNTLVVIVRVIFADDLQELENKLEQVQTIIGGL